MSTIDLEAAAPTVTDYGNGSPNVRFIAMQHVATPAFFESAQRQVRAAQEDGYMDTPLTDPVSTAIPPEGWMSVARDSRNAHLARCTHEAEHEQIVITFGAAHEPGWLAEMQKLDSPWARSDGTLTT